MKIWIFLLLVFYSGAMANWDSLQIRVGASHSAAGIWIPKGKLPKQPGVIIWLHGGMQSGKCEKGFEAGKAVLPWISDKGHVVASPSVCKDQHWLTPNGLDVIESLLDSLENRFHINLKRVMLIGISDGGFGLAHYSVFGKRKIAHRILISTYPGAWIPMEKIGDMRAQLSTGTWTFLQGGADRLFPAQKTKPWMDAFCAQISQCIIHWDSLGEHDLSWWIEHRPAWLKASFNPQD